MRQPTGRRRPADARDPAARRRLTRCGLPATSPAGPVSSHRLPRTHSAAPRPSPYTPRQSSDKVPVSLPALPSRVRVFFGGCGPTELGCQPPGCGRCRQYRALRQCRGRRRWAPDADRTGSAARRPTRLARRHTVARRSASPFQSPASAPYLACSALSRGSGSAKNWNRGGTRIDTDRSRGRLTSDPVSSPRTCGSTLLRSIETEQERPRSAARPGCFPNLERLLRAPPSARPCSRPTTPTWAGGRRRTVAIPASSCGYPMPGPLTPPSRGGAGRSGSCTRAKTGTSGSP